MNDKREIIIRKKGTERGVKNSRERKEKEMGEKLLKTISASSEKK